MQLTLVRPPAAPGLAPVSLDGIHMRAILECDLEAVGRLYYSAGYADEAVGSEADAWAEIQASWQGEYGAWIHEASLLSEHNGIPVAAVLTVDSPPWDDVADLVFVIDLFTASALRGHGIARLLMHTALAAVGVSREVGLRVDSDNEPAVRLSRALGFRIRDTGYGIRDTGYGIRDTGLYRQRCHSDTGRSAMRWVAGLGVAAFDDVHLDAVPA